MWRNKVNGLNAFWLMNGTTFSSIVNLPAVTDTSWRIVATGDFNGDGQRDIVWRNGVESGGEIPNRADAPLNPAHLRLVGLAIQAMPIRTIQEPA